jgi:hypothetical protein
MANKFDLRKLQMMCKELGKPVPEDWPEGLDAIPQDMRDWVSVQTEKKVVPKKAASKPKKVEKTE